MTTFILYIVANQSCTIATNEICELRASLRFTVQQLLLCCFQWYPMLALTCFIFHTTLQKNLDVDDLPQE